MAGFATPLQPADWDQWLRVGREYIQQHPRANHRGLSREERLAVPGAKEAFAIVTRSENAAGRALGAQPCCHCGTWTHSWCECCASRPPSAICTGCDAEKKICPTCEQRGGSWEQGHQRQTNEEGILEVSGFHDEEGAFHELQPPLRVKAALVLDSRGNIDQEKLDEIIFAAHSERSSSSRSGVPSGP